MAYGIMFHIPPSCLFLAPALKQSRAVAQWARFSESPEQLLYSRLVTERNCPHPAFPLAGSTLASPSASEDSLEAEGWVLCMCG